MAAGYFSYFWTCGQLGHEPFSQQLDLAESADKETGSVPSMVAPVRIVGSAFAAENTNARPIADDKTSQVEFLRSTM